MISLLYLSYTPKALTSFKSRGLQSAPRRKGGQRAPSKIGSLGYSQILQYGLNACPENCENTTPVESNVAYFQKIGHNTLGRIRLKGHFSIKWSFVVGQMGMLPLHLLATLLVPG